MAPPKKSLSRLLSLSGAVTAEQRAQNIHDNVIATDSHAVNFTYGNGWGLPMGYSLLLYGPPRGGKTILSNMMAGWLHKNDPDAIVVKFNTEMRETAQANNTQSLDMYGIDPDRLISYQTNLPTEIFDRIEKDIAAEIQEGLKVKLIIIDSLTAIRGRRDLNADSIETQQIGDQALTIQSGLSRILAVQRRLNIGLVMTAHIRAQMDLRSGGSAMVYKSQTAAVKPAVSYATQHHCEYYMYVEPRGGKEGRTNELGESFVDESVEDMKGDGEVTGHKISVRMTDASFGPKNRSGVFTFDYHKGLINVHEEVFNLGVGRNVIEKPTNLKYAFGGREWVGRPAMLEALKNDPKLQADIVAELRRRDLAGILTEEKPDQPHG